MNSTTQHDGYRFQEAIKALAERKSNFRKDLLRISNLELPTVEFLAEHKKSDLSLGYRVWITVKMETLDVYFGDGHTGFNKKPECTIHLTDTGFNLKDNLKN